MEGVMTGVAVQDWFSLEGHCDSGQMGALGDCGDPLMMFVGAHFGASETTGAGLEFLHEVQIVVTMEEVTVGGVIEPCPMGFWVHLPVSQGLDELIGGGALMDEVVIHDLLPQLPVFVLQFGRVPGPSVVMEGRVWLVPGIGHGVKSVT